MFQKDDKRRLYWLIDQFLLGKISARTFCDEYYYCYSLELDYETLTDLEKEAFSILSNIASRFSEFSEDRVALPSGFYNEDELKQKVIETRDKLTK